MFGVKTIDKLPAKYLNAIEEISNETANGDGWWIYLKPPYINTELECRIIHEQTLAECISILKDCVNYHKDN